WVGQPDVSPFWLSNQPLLLWPAMLAFLLGCWYCLRRWPDPRAVVLLFSILLTSLFGGAIWTAAPLYVRYMAGLPAIVLLVAVGLEKTFFRDIDTRQPKLINSSFDNNRGLSGISPVGARRALPLQPPAHPQISPPLLAGEAGRGLIVPALGALLTLLIFLT